MGFKSAFKGLIHKPSEHDLCSRFRRDWRPVVNRTLSYTTE